MGKTIDLDKARAAKDAVKADETKARGAKKRARGLKFFLIGAAGIFAALTFITQSQRMLELRAEEARLKQQLMELENTTQRLERMIQYSQTDAYVEQMAVKLFGMVKPGDILFYADPESEGAIIMETVPDDIATLDIPPDDTSADDTAADDIEQSDTSPSPEPSESAEPTDPASD